MSNEISSLANKAKEILFLYEWAKTNKKWTLHRTVTSINKNAESAYGFALHVIKGRFIEGEEVISKDAGYAYEYAKNVIKGRFPKGEEVIAKNATVLINYANFVFPELSPVIVEALEKVAQANIAQENKVT